MNGGKVWKPLIWVFLAVHAAVLVFLPLGIHDIKAGIVTFWQYYFYIVTMVIMVLLFMVVIATLGFITREHFREYEGEDKTEDLLK